MPPNISAGPRLVVVELVGPVVDDAGAVARTVADALTHGGLDLLPGALMQASGMAPEHALRTLAEGHGRFELVEQLGQLVSRTVPALVAWASTGNATIAPGALEAWRAIASSGSSRAMLTTLPTQAARSLTQRLDIDVAEEEWIVADDSRGPPHPDHIRQFLARSAVGAEAVALVSTVGAALAAASAGCRVIAVGGRGGATMFADAQVARIEEFR